MNRIKGLGKSIGSQIRPDTLGGVHTWIRNHRPRAFGGDIPDPPGRYAYHGQVVMIIGAVGHLGEEIARLFVLHGCSEIYLVGDNLLDLRTLERHLNQDPRLNPDKRTLYIYCIHLDLLDPEGVNNFTLGIIQTLPEIHVLVLNAAAFFPEFGSIAAGNVVFVERMMQVNCFSQILIFLGLRGVLRAGGVARNSPAHVTFVTCPWMDNEYGEALPNTVRHLRNRLCNQVHFQCGPQLHLSKLLTTFFVYYFSVVCSENDGRTVVNTVDPGTLRHSNLYRHFLPNVVRSVAEACSLFGRHEKKAALVVHAATLGAARTHGNCIVNRSQLRGQNIVTQYARSGCEQLVYRTICSVILKMTNIPLNLPIDYNANTPIVDHPWDRTM